MNQRSREEQIEFIMEHYEDPLNWGSMEDADIAQKMGNPGCGDIVTVYLKFNYQDRVERISFEGEGCTISLAGTSMIMEMVEGKTIEEVALIPQDAIIDILGRELAMTRPRCSTLGLSAVRQGLREYRNKKLLEQIQREKDAEAAASNEKGS
jgi:nitrogen fixation NifU-like protein